MSKAQDAAHRAANRLHHLSMRYAGSVAELGRGKKVGLIPSGAAGLTEVRDLIDLILLLRAEVNALTKLLIESKLGITEETCLAAFTDEYQWLCDQKADFLDVGVEDYGLVFRPRKGGEE